MFSCACEQGNVFSCACEMQCVFPTASFDLHVFPFARCENGLISFVNMKNCIQFYQTAEEMEAEVLKKHCSELISNHWVRDDEGSDGGKFVSIEQCNSALPVREL